MDCIIKKEMEEEKTTFEEPFCLPLKTDEEDQLVRYSFAKYFLGLKLFNTCRVKIRMIFISLCSIFSESFKILLY